MKKFILAICMITGVAVSGYCAEGTLMYEAASSTWTCKQVTVSNVTWTLIDISTTSNQFTDTLGNVRNISRYSITAQNLSSDYAVYQFTDWAKTTPDTNYTCANAPVIAAAASNSPAWVTEQNIGMKMWALACGSADADFRVIRRGR